jgi:hypothetical protein
MNTADNAGNNGLTTEQIAAAGAGPVQDRPGPGAQAQAGMRAGQPIQRLPGDADIADADIADAGIAGEEGGFEDRGSFGPAGVGAASAAEEDSVRANREPRANLLEGDELRNIVSRWKEIQAMFVDEPTRAVEEADALVAELMQRLAGMFARERADLEQQWAGGNRVSTEELRQGLRRYRSFFERLLAA